jgi:hypothetical protein
MARYERRSPFNPSEVVAEIVALMRQYRRGTLERLIKPTLRLHSKLADFYDNFTS